MDQKTDKRRVAIACQGGGSHAAFTAGALAPLLRFFQDRQHEYQLVAFSGTSGGAICAFLTWFALLENDNEQQSIEKTTNEAIDTLHSFWAVDNSAYWKPRDPYRSGMDVLANNSLALSGLFRAAGEAAFGIQVNTELNPYDWQWHSLFDYWRDRLKEMIESRIRKLHPGRNIDQSIEERVRGSRRDLKLFIGAVNACTGEFQVFKSHKKKDGGFNDNDEDRISIDAVLASAAIPTIFEATRTGQAVYWDASRPPDQRTYLDEGVYWDGLYSQNPPIRDLTDADPDEIWIIQINPEEIDKEPKSSAAIEDRRNELAGNVSLNQELYFVRKVNELVEQLGEWENDDANILRKVLRVPEPDQKEYRIIKERRLELAMPLDVWSKLDRNPSRIEDLINHGEDQAGHFLQAVPSQITFEQTWERALRYKDEENIAAVMGFFAQEPVVELVPPAGSSGEPASGEGWKTQDPDELRNVVRWLLRNNLTLEQSRDYRVRQDRPGEKVVVTCWALATADNFAGPIKGRAEAVVQKGKVERLTFYPLSLNAMDELKEAVENHAGTDNT